MPSEIAGDRGPDAGDAVTLADARRCVGDDPASQRRTWAFQRLGWAAMAAFVVAAYLDLLGGTGLARHAAASPDGAFRVTYEATVRRSRATTWAIDLPPGATELSINDAAFSLFQPRMVLPRPVGELQHHDQLTLTFASRDGEVGRVRIVAVPIAPGAQVVSFDAGGRSLSIQILVLP